MGNLSTKNQKKINAKINLSLAVAIRKKMKAREMGEACLRWPFLLYPNAKRMKTSKALLAKRNASRLWSTINLKKFANQYIARKHETRKRGNVRPTIKPLQGFSLFLYPLRLHQRRLLPRRALK
jgi:hypothetical protein